LTTRIQVLVKNLKQNDFFNKNRIIIFFEKKIEINADIK